MIVCRLLMAMWVWLEHGIFCRWAQVVVVQVASGCHARCCFLYWRHAVAVLRSKIEH